MGETAPRVEDNRSSSLRSRLKWVIPFGVGVLTWEGLKAYSGEAEAWDDGAPYYTVSFVAAFILGLVIPTRWPLAGLPGLLLAGGQLGALLVTTEENTFLVLGLFIFVAMACLFGMVSFVGAALRRRFWKDV